MIKSYIPLYRKYRPQSFADLVGQEAISKTFANAIDNDRIAHAYIFTGPRGTGKTSSARILAKSLNCEKGPTKTPCGVCSSCIDITNGTALDVIEIDAASNRSVEDARDLIEKVQFAPVSGRYKVYIIDEVHMLTSQAFNTLLKTLEEPPPNLVFILATTEIHKVLDTIISRCQRFDFRRITQEDVVKRLEYIAKIENISVGKAALNLIARRSSGGMRDALGLLDQISVLSSMGKSIEVDDIINLIGALPEDSLLHLSKVIAQKDAGKLIQLLSELMDNGNEPVQIVRELTIHYRDLLIAATLTTSLDGIINTSKEFQNELTDVAKMYSQLELAQIIDRLAYTEKMVRNSTQPSLWIEVGLISICYRNDLTLIEELQKRIDKLEEAILTGKLPDTMQPDYLKKQPIPVYKAPIEIKEASTVKAPITKTAIEMKEEVKIQTEVAPLTATIENTAILETISIEEPLLEKEINNDERSNILKPSTFPIESTWQKILDNVLHPPTKGILTSIAFPMAITSEEIVIGVIGDTFVSQLKEEKRLKSIEEAISQVLDTIPPIRIVYSPNPEPPKKNQKIEPAKQVGGIKSQSYSKETIINENKNKETECSDQYDNLDDIAIEEKDVITDNTIERQIMEDLPEQVEYVKSIFQGRIINL